MPEQKDLFTRLKKLFSTDVIVRNVGGKKLRIIDTDAVQYATDKNSLRDRFNRLRSSTYNLHNRDMSLSYQSARLELFRDYDVMDMDPILSSALDIYADECLVPSEFGQVLTIRSKNENTKKILENLFYDIMNIEFNLWSWVRNMPVKYNSPIPLLSGEIITIEDVSTRIKTGEDVWVYSVQDNTNKIVPGKVVWCDKNYTSNKIIKVTLDDGSIMETAPEHPFILRSGLTKRADELLENDSLMPFYRKLSPKKGGMNEYEMIYDPETDDYEFTHRLVAKSTGAKINKKERVLHHKNFNKYDNRPENLLPMDFHDHRKLHAEHCKEILHSPEVTKKRLAGIDKYLRSDTRRNRLSAEMRGKLVLPFIKYNSSEAHKTHNLTRSQKKIEMWKDPIRSQLARFNMKVKWSSRMLDIYNEVKSKENTTVPKTCDILKNNLEFISEWNLLNNRKFRRIQQKDMTPFVVSNHKVSRIDVIDEVADVYCMTVVGPNGEDDRHNFSMCGRDANGTVMPNSGVFVKNCKYGDFFLKLELSPEYGVYTVRPLSAYEITRVEGSDPTNINYVKYQHDGLGGGSEYENFEIAHIRLISDSNFLPYGKSMLEGARRVWKQLSLMEDAMLIHRIMRAPEKRIFKIDVGNIPPSEIDGFIQKIMNQIKKVPYIDERTGDYNLRFNLNNMVEDFYLPVRGGDSGTTIDTLPGMEFTGTEDIEYIRNKMMAALKIPKAFLGYEEGISGKATLAAEDVRFSRTIARLQRIIISELSKIAIVHLYIQGYTDASLVDFELELTNPSTIFEQEKVAIWQDKVNLAKDMMESKLFSRDWIYHNIWNMSDDDVEKLKESVVTDQKNSWRLEQIFEQGNDPMKSKQSVDGEGNITDMVGDEGPPGGGAETDLPELKEVTKEEGVPLEEKKERDQTGNKEKYSTRQVKNRGEDVLGDMENRAKTTSNPIKHKFKGGSPLSLDEELKKVKASLSIKFGKGKKALLEKKSLLDESNLITEGVASTENVVRAKSILDESNLMDDDKAV